MKQTEGSEETGLLAQPTERVLGASLGAPPASQQSFSGGRCSALPPGLSPGSKTGAAPSGWRFSLCEDNATALRFPPRKSLEVQEPKVLQCNPCPSAPTQSLLPEPMARAAPRCCCSQRISTTSIALQYEPVRILTCSMLLKPRPSACSAETLRDRGAEDHAGGSPALSGSRGIPFSPTNAPCLLLPAPKAGCQWISPPSEVVSGRAGGDQPRWQSSSPVFGQEWIRSGKDTLIQRCVSHPLQEPQQLPARSRLLPFVLRVWAGQTPQGW